MAKDTKNNDDAYKSKVCFETYLNAWIENRMEFGKRLLTISALAIGLLTTLKISSVEEFKVWLFSGIFYLITIAINLWTFKLNAQYLSCLLQDKDNEPHTKFLNRKLQYLDIISSLTFITGIVSTFYLVVMRSIDIIVTVKG